MTVRPRSPRGEGVNLREEVLIAAERLLLEHGSDEAVSIRAVAAEVGVTPPAIYRHFADKTSLILAVCGKQFADFEARMNKAVLAAKDPLDDLRLRGDTYIRYGLEHPEAYQVMFMRPPGAIGERQAALEEPPEAFTSLASSVQRAMDAGLLEPDDPSHVAQIIWSVVHGITSLLIAQPAFPWGRQERLIDGALYAAVCPFLSRKGRRSLSAPAAKPPQ